MKMTKIAMTALLAVCAATPAMAARVHVWIGAPFWGPPGYYYPPPAYYYPPTVVAVPVSPPTYIEQTPVQAQTQPASSGVWYYCAKPKGYYPYVKTCPGGWQPVAPAPPSDAGQVPPPESATAPSPQ